MTAEEDIRRRIARHGPITWAEFMDLALYGAGGGYYASPQLEEGPWGPAGDYYTSPLTHPAFGALLSVQLYQCWQLLGCPNPFYVVEPGAGNGLLCRDILTAAQHLPEGFIRNLRYLCVDLWRPGEPLERGLLNAERIVSRGLPLRGVYGCVLSNELLDAFPVHQVRQERGRLREVFVAVAQAPPLRAGVSNATGPTRVKGQERPLPLVTQLDEPSTPELAARLSRVGISLAEGQTAEINLGLEEWSAAVAECLTAGFVLTIDYGQTAEELYSAELRPRGALTTFYRHVQTDAPLLRIGQQDITAQVDFTSLVNAGRKAGLEPLGYTLQRRFLENLGIHRLRRRPSAGRPQLTAGKSASAELSGISALVRPGGLGGFKVLVQGKRVGQPVLWGLEHCPEAVNLVELLPEPRLTEQHLSLPAGWPSGDEPEFILEWLGVEPFPGS